MQEQDWALLGIAPTAELVAIKKAYALKLRVTRPDDDAQAYQALRGAYERAQKWVGLQRQDQQPFASQPSPHAGATSSTTSATKASTSADDHLLTTPLPSEYVAHLNRLHHSQGNATLMTSWPEIEAMLVEQPLSRRAAWSATFGRWVIEQPSLPFDFVEALCLHFEWLDDYRIERQIGIDLAEPLQRAISAHAIRQAVADQVGEPATPAPPAPPSADVLERVAIIEKLVNRRVSARSRFWLTVLLRPMLVSLTRGLDRDALDACGVDPLSQDVLRRALSTSGRLRALVLFASLLAVFGAFADEIRYVIFQGVIWAGIAATWMALAHFLGLLMNYGPLLEPPGKPPLSRWRQHRLHPVPGLCLLGFVAALTWGAPRIATTAGVLLSGGTVDSLYLLWRILAWPLALVGAALAWPRSVWSSPVSAGLLLAVVASAWPGAAGNVTRAGLLAAAAAYVLAGTAIYEGKLRAGRLLGAAFYPIAITLKLGERWGWTFALMPGVLPLAALLAWKPALHATTLALVWTCLAACIYEFHRRSETWALARLNRAT
jgi:hypothetical protein